MLAVRDHLKTGGDGELLMEWHHFESALKELKELPAVCRPNEGTK